MPFTIAAAQSSSVKGQLAQNVDRHVRFILRAAELHVDLIVFPELSLTGYELSVASECAITPDAPVLQPLVDLANQAQMLIVAGCPIRSPQDKPYLGAVILRPGEPVGVYRKRFVHASELAAFQASNDSCVFSHAGQNIGVAICADISHPVHPADAISKQATLYAASVAKTPEETVQAEATLQLYARQHQLPTLMSNYAAATGGIPMAGRSAIWDAAGNPVAQADGLGECIVLAEHKLDKWAGRVLVL